MNHDEIWEQSAIRRWAIEMVLKSVPVDSCPTSEIVEKAAAFERYVMGDAKCEPDAKAAE